MDALRKVQEMCKEMPLEEALLLLVCVLLVVFIVGFSAIAVLLRKKRAKVHGRPEVVVDVVSGRSGPGAGATKESSTGSTRAKASVEIAVEGGGGQGRGGRRSIDSPLSAMWQRRILMGERCQLPKFSGVILYDERGQPLQQQQQQQQQEQVAASHQVKPAAVVTTSLKELL